MDLEIHVNDQIHITTKLDEAISLIVEAIKYWNNFEDDKPLEITLRKIKTTGPPALGITVDEAVDSADLFGRR